MIAISRYCEANAIAHAILPRLLTRDDYAALARGPTVQESWNTLRKTAYGAWLPEETAPDALGLERRLREVTAIWLHESTRRLHGRAAAVGHLLLARWELDHLQFSLRLWHGKDAHFEALLGFPLFLNEVAPVAMVSAESLEDLAKVLRKTPYARPLRESAALYRQSGSMVYPELALERDYYGRLLAAARALGGSDGRTAVGLVSDEIDGLNVSWLNRLHAYHHVPEDRIGDLLIPGPSRFSRQASLPGADYEALAGSANALIAPYGEGGGGHVAAADRAALLERALDEMAIARARAGLRSYPFSIAGVFSFQRILRTELGNLCRVFTGKRVGVADQDLLHRIRGVI